MALVTQLEPKEGDSPLHGHSFLLPQVFSKMWLNVTTRSWLCSGGNKHGLFKRAEVIQRNATQEGRNKLIRSQTA